MDSDGRGGLILIGSSEPAFLVSLTGHVSDRFDSSVRGCSDSADLLLEAAAQNISIAIIDTNLRGLPVAKTVQFLKKCRPRVSIIVISDDYSVDTGGCIAELGIFYYMYKPLELDSLTEVIDSAIRKRLRDDAMDRV